MRHLATFGFVEDLHEKKPRGNAMKSSPHANPTLLALCLSNQLPRFAKTEMYAAYILWRLQMPRRKDRP